MDEATEITSGAAGGLDHGNPGLSPHFNKVHVLTFISQQDYRDFEEPIIRMLADRTGGRILSVSDQDSLSDLFYTIEIPAWEGSCIDRLQAIKDKLEQWKSFRHELLNLTSDNIALVRRACDAAIMESCGPWAGKFFMTEAWRDGATKRQELDHDTPVNKVFITPPAQPQLK